MVPEFEMPTSHFSRLRPICCEPRPARRAAVAVQMSGWKVNCIRLLFSSGICVQSRLRRSNPELEVLPASVVYMRLSEMLLSLVGRHLVVPSVSWRRCSNPNAGCHLARLGGEDGSRKVSSGVMSTRSWRSFIYAGRGERFSICAQGRWLSPPEPRRSSTGPRTNLSS
jgi:hypothetical protein